MSPASLLLGLSRRPLSPADESRARRLTPAVATPAQRGLALLTVDALEARTADLAAAPAVGTEYLPPPPPHPDYGATETALLALVDDFRALSARGLPRFLRRRGLLLPAATLTDELARLRRARELAPGHFLGLGPRGAYLLPLVEQSPYREAALFSPEGIGQAFAKTPPKRALRTRGPLLGYTLGLLGARGLPEALKRPYRDALAEVLRAAALADDTRRAALALLAADQLGATLSPEVLAQALPGAGDAVPLPPLQHYRLLRAAAPVDAACAKTLQDAVTRASGFLADFDPDAPPRAEKLPQVAAAIYLLRAGATAARVFRACVTADDHLLREHPALTTLLAATDATQYARCIHDFAESSARGWAHPAIASWLADTDHCLGPDDSERLVSDALLRYGPGPASLAERYPLALHPDVVEVLHEFEERGRGVATARRLTSVLAQAARVTAAYPMLA